MSETTGIKWCDSTVNFWSGCTKVSPGCANCYAETLAGRFDTLGKWGKGKPRQLHENTFKLAAKLNRKPIIDDGFLSPHRRRIFSLSLGDWLDPEVPVDWLARMLDTVRQCQDVDWLLCTKRPELWRERLHRVALTGGIDPATRDLASWASRREVREMARAWIEDETYPENIVLLTSVENQEQADKRIPELLRIPAWRRGLSCEPLLGPVDLSGQSYGGYWKHVPAFAGLHWVIVGGESGDKARPCDVGWIRSLRDQCEAAAVPCFVKQLGAVPFAQKTKVEKGVDGGKVWNNYTDEIKLTDRKGGDWNEWPEDLKVREFYKP